MTNLLLVEDDAQILKSLSLNLSLSGFKVTEAMNLAQAQNQMSQNEINLILLDINLPDGTGLDFCRKLRDEGCDLPILFLSARVDEETVVEGMNIGADDYIRKPFGTEELKARIKKALSKMPTNRKQIKAGPLVLDVSKRQALVSDQPLSLGKREFDILTVMAQKPGDVVSRESILAFLGERADIYDRTIDSHISHLRRKIKDIAGDTLKLSSVYGVGYKLEWK